MLERWWSITTSAAASLNSTQLYVLIVMATMMVSLHVLGLTPPVNVDASSSSSTSVSAATSARKRPPSALPEPKWHIFKYINYVCVVAFLYSIFYHANDHSSSNSTILFLMAWSLFLCYFFGFFGVSFVGIDEEAATTDIDATAASPSTSTEKPEAAVAIETDKQDLGCGRSNTHKTRKAYSPDASNEEIAALVLNHEIKDYELEKLLPPSTYGARAVNVRRLVVERKLSTSLAALPAEPSLDYGSVYGTNCETVLGYVPIPVGLVGPLQLNGRAVYVPMATTEGCLVASTNRGAKALVHGATAVVLKDAMTRAPCLQLPSAAQAAQVALWCQVPSNVERLQQAFGTTTRFGQLQRVQPTVAGRNVYLRLSCFAGDAMGMNMISKGALAVIEYLKRIFPNIKLVALSGNMCTDKKASATNWIEGRGKSVVVEAIVPQHVVQSTLKTTVQALVDTNIQKNLVGSAMSGTLGGFNAHAANIVTAIFLATGQDPAQNVESSNCITLMEEHDGDLWISCTMPSLEVGTVGGGTSLAAQAACLGIIGCQGATPASADPATPTHAQQLAMVISAAVLAGELSLMAALAANTLVQAHMQHNRKAPGT
jgi:hydroxymethylglutaryl-CoA reductase (NADPH)